MEIPHNISESHSELTKKKKRGQVKLLNWGFKTI